jgi:GTP-binding protein
VPTNALNRVMQAAQAQQQPPLVRGRRPKVLYATQGATDPPTFTLFVSHELPPSYLRYLERRIREAFELGPTPVKMRVRRRPR